MKCPRSQFVLFVSLSLAGCAPLTGDLDAGTDRDAAYEDVFAPDIQSSNTSTLTAQMPTVSVVPSSVVQAVVPPVQQTSVEAVALPVTLAQTMPLPEAAGKSFAQPRDFFVRVDVTHGANDGRETLVAWGEHHVFVSDDAGLTFRSVAQGVKLYERRNLAVADDGTIYIQRASDRLEVIDAQGQSHLQSMSFGAGTDALVAAGTTLVWFGRVAVPQDATDEEAAVDGQVTMAISPDHGASWSKPRALGWPGNAGNEFAVRSNGTFLHLYGSEAGCGGGGQSLDRGDLHDAPGTPLREGGWDLDAPGMWSLASSGRAWAIDELSDDGRFAQLVLVEDGASRKVLDLQQRTEIHGNIQAVSNLRVDYVNAGGSLVRHDGQSTTVVSRGLASDFALYAVDTHDRPLGILGGVIQRFDASTGLWVNLTDNAH